MLCWVASGPDRARGVDVAAEEVEYEELLGVVAVAGVVETRTQVEGANASAQLLVEVGHPVGCFCIGARLLIMLDKIPFLPILFIVINKILFLLILVIILNKN